MNAVAAWLSETPSATNIIVLIGIVAVLAVVQSVFGVGLLLFGTPLLLLLGMPFALVLAYLLPCSIAVSSLQVATTGGLTLEPIRRQFLVFTLPLVLAATVVTLIIGSMHQTRVVVGVMLLATAVTRIGRLHSALRRFVRNHIRAMMLGLGVIHGLSNLGGGILTVIVGSSFEDKASIRRHIAFAYGAMAAIQLLVVLIASRPHLNVWLWLTLPVVSACIYLLIGQRAFSSTRERAYQFGLTGVIASFGFILVGTA